MSVDFEVNLGPTSATDALDDYLNTPRLKCDPIKYWKARLPEPLARMALDFLTAPGKYPISYANLN
jgi:hypothetical protein